MTVEQVMHAWYEGGAREYFACPKFVFGVPLCTCGLRHSEARDNSLWNLLPIFATPVAVEIKNNETVMRVFVTEIAEAS